MLVTIYCHIAVAKKGSRRNTFSGGFHAGC